jgi:hypothetical protein
LLTTLAGNLRKLLPDIAFTVLKIEMLKTPVHCAPEEQVLFPGINLKKRIDNIEKTPRSHSAKRLVHGTERRRVCTYLFQKVL